MKTKTRNANDTVEHHTRDIQGNDKCNSMLDGKMEWIDIQKKPENKMEGTSKAAVVMGPTSFPATIPMKRSGKVDTEKALIVMFNNVLEMLERQKIHEPVEQRLDYIGEKIRDFESQVKLLTASLAELQNAIATSQSGLEKLLRIDIPEARAKLLDHESKFKSSTAGLVRSAAVIEELVGEFRDVLHDAAIQNSKERMANMDNAVRLMSLVKINEGMGSTTMNDDLLEKIAGLEDNLKTATAMILRKIENMSERMEQDGLPTTSFSSNGVASKQLKNQSPGNS